MELNRLPNETDYEYHKRLIYGKLEDKSFADVDFAELSDLIYGQHFSSDFARKMMRGSYRTLKLEEKSFGTEHTCAEAPDDREPFVLSEVEEIRKERQKLFDQRRELTKLLSKEGRREHLEEKLAEAADLMTRTVGRVFPWEPRYAPVITDSEAVLVLCDWHYGMTAENIWNEYSTEICKERVRTVVEKTIQKILLHGCARLNILLLGDLLHGSIHTSARVASEELVCEQIMHVAEIIAQAIEELSQYAPHTRVYCTYGNHARTIQNKHDSIHRDNMERLIPWWLTERMKSYEDVDIMPESPNEFLIMEICGKYFCATHGDLDSVKTAPRLLSTLVRKACGHDIDYILLADKHHREGFEELGVSAVICGSLCGTDEYANTKRLYSTPEQLLLIVNELDGVDAKYHIKCN